MFPPFRILRSLVLWSHGRATWQYDVLCALILAFIFLTPKSWFDNGKLEARFPHQNGSTAAQKLLVWPESRIENPDTQEIERRARIATGRSDLRVRSVQPKRDRSGEIVAYEVDIE